MRGKKEQELLKDVLAVFLRYDCVIVEQCLDYLLENKQDLYGWLTFANGGESETQNNGKKSAIDKVVSIAGREKGPIIRRIYKCLSSKRFTYEQICHISAQYFEKIPISIDLNAANKNEFLLALAQGLTNLPVDDIREFEYYIQAQPKANAENENTLENWSKVIIKPPSE